ncbi:hypothetical protein KR018_008703 [Drosophila ironensis]|nr:hypothetical protein KR018_008703 [Drosophila ironensis]
MASADIQSSCEPEGNVPSPGLFTSHCATFDAGEGKYTLRVLKMPDSTLLVVNSQKADLLGELAIAMPDRNPKSSESISSTILGGYGQTDSSVMATKLSKRYRRPFYVSMNLQLDRLQTPLFEKALVAYMNAHQEHFI